MTNKQNKTKGLREKIEEILETPVVAVESEELTLDAMDESWHKTKKKLYQEVIDRLVDLFRQEFLELVEEDENDGKTTIDGEECWVISTEWTRGYNKAKVELRKKVEKIK